MWHKTKANWTISSKTTTLLINNTTTALHMLLILLPNSRTHLRAQIAASLVLLYKVTFATVSEREMHHLMVRESKALLDFN